MNDKKKKTNGNNRPAYAKRVGSIRVTVWQNQTAEGKTFFNSSLVRRYKDGDEFKESNSLNGLADIASAMFALNAAAKFISNTEDEQNQDANEEA